MRACRGCEASFAVLPKGHRRAFCTRACSDRARRRTNPASLAARAKDAARSREWRAANADRLREWRAVNAEKRAAYQRAWAAAYPDRVAAHERSHRERHREERAASERVRYWGVSRLADAAYAVHQLKEEVRNHGNR